mmetsp:Transcript_124091/g.218534  ORF Transcript_124091/g.218534 Transcript_124091/m.218534 type:complete len:211 (+) Transcript_124091:66-698(+)
MTCPCRSRILSGSRSSWRLRCSGNTQWDSEGALWNICARLEMRLDRALPLGKRLALIEKLQALRRVDGHQEEMRAAKARILPPHLGKQLRSGEGRKAYWLDCRCNTVGSARQAVDSNYGRQNVAILLRILGHGVLESQEVDGKHGVFLRPLCDWVMWLQIHAQGRKKAYTAIGVTLRLLEPLLVDLAMQKISQLCNIVNNHVKSVRRLVH